MLPMDNLGKHYMFGDDRIVLVGVIMIFRPIQLNYAGTIGFENHAFRGKVLFQCPAFRVRIGPPAPAIRVRLTGWCSHIACTI